MANDKFKNLVEASPFRDERLYLVDLLGKHQSIRKAAAAVGISHETLYKKCREHKVSVKRKLDAS